MTYEEWVDWWRGRGLSLNSICYAEYPPSGNLLVCLNPKGHSGPHQAWLGYDHREPCEEWSDPNEMLEVEEGL